jgi:hypothetical protein
VALTTLMARDILAGHLLAPGGGGGDLIRELFMGGLKPTPEMLLKAHIAKQCAARILWAEAKKKAEAKKVDVKLFKRDLGPELDKLRDVCEGALQVKKHYGKLDPKTIKTVKDQSLKVEKIIRDYGTLCTQESKKPGVTADQKKAWESLKSQLDTTAAAPANMTRPALK